MKHCTDIHTSFAECAWTFVALLAALAAGVSPAAGQDTIRQTVIVTAAAAPVDLASVTRTVTVITRDQLASLPVRTVADVLRLVASVDVRSRGERGVQTDFAIRGASFGQTLVLVDGVRLNDAQTGHHNGDIPVPLEDVERIEVLHGPGSSLFGADAFGGTINVITRRDLAPASAGVEAGSFGLVAAKGSAGFMRGPVRQTLSGSAARSSGFMFERQFATAVVRSQTSFGERSTVSGAYLWNDFGANGFYGPSPSHEWTNQALLALDHRLVSRASWRIDAQASYRSHGDRFLWDVQRPGQFENRHRTHAALGTVRALRGLGASGSLVFGTEAGSDWIRSSNLGDHKTSRVAAFAEWRQALTSRTQLDASLRVDRYTEFGAAWSPGIGAGWWPLPSLRLRASVGRAFRVPTFTERYYSDPANWARPEVGPETAWAGDTGGDLFLSNGWALQATLFGRRERNVIDWLRPTPGDRWRTYNVRNAATRGVELGATKTFADGVFVRASYTGVEVRAGSVTQLSKYLLDYAPHALAAAAAVRLPGQLRVAPRLEYKRRRVGATPRAYTVLDARVARQFGRYELSVEGTNLLSEVYEELAGVAMPDRAVRAAVAITTR